MELRRRRPRSRAQAFLLYLTVNIMFTWYTVYAEEESKEEVVADFTTESTRQLKGSSNPLEDIISKRNIERTTTMYPRIQFHDWIEQNPIFKSLAMFQSNDITSNLDPDKANEVTAQTPPAEDDNFNWQYKELNHSLYAQTDKPDDEVLATISPAMAAGTAQEKLARPGTIEAAGTAQEKLARPGTLDAFITRIPGLNSNSQESSSQESSSEEVSISLEEALRRVATAIPKVSDSFFGNRTQELTPTESKTGTADTSKSPSPPYYRVPDFMTISLNKNPLKSAPKHQHGVNTLLGTGEVLGVESWSSTLAPSTRKLREKESQKTALPLATLPPNFWEKITLPATLSTPPLQRRQLSTVSPFSTPSFSPNQAVKYFTTHHRYLASTSSPKRTTPARFTLRATKRRPSTIIEDEEIALARAASEEWTGWNEQWGNPITRDELVLFNDVESTTSWKLTQDSSEDSAGSSHISDANRRKPSEGTELRVSGTKYYEEPKKNKMSGRTGKKKHRKGKGKKNSRKNGETRDEWGRGEGSFFPSGGDKRYAMEREIQSSKKLADEITHTSDNFKKEFNRKQRYVKRYKWDKKTKINGMVQTAPLSEAHMVKKNGKEVEERVSIIGGQMITVDVMNPLLHGVDLMMEPGAVIHDDLSSLSSARDKRREFEEEYKRNGHLSSRTALRVKPEVYHRKSGTSGRSIIGSGGAARPNKCCEEDTEITLSERATGEKVVIPLETSSRRSGSVGLYAQVDQTAFVAGEKLREPTSEEKHAMRSCYSERKNCYMIDASPLERRIGLNSFECLRFCASITGCLSVSYSSTLSICDVFNTRNGTGRASLVKLLGYSYFEPKTASSSRCLATSHVHAKAAKLKNSKQPLSTNVQVSTELFRVAESHESALALIQMARQKINITLTDSSRCVFGEDPMFLRSKGIRDEGGQNLDTVLNISEDDCVFSCVANLAGYYDSFECVSAQYDSYNEACTLSSDAAVDRRLVSESNSNFYEKICINNAVSSRCSGATIDRRRQRTLTGLSRETVTVISPLDCIEACVDPLSRLQFQCLSALYYYQEKTRNCVLNDGSAYTHPDSIADETTAVVDYFGIDECHGLKEIRHTVRLKGSALSHSAVHDGRVSKKQPPDHMSVHAYQS